MTTIAWDGRYLVSDRQVTIGGTKYRCDKIKVLADGSLAAFAGSANDIAKVIRWLNDPENYEYPDEAECLGLVVSANKLFYIFDGEAVELDRDQQIAIGSGGEVALGSMKAGLSAKDAVEIVTLVDIQSGFGVAVYDTEEHFKQVAKSQPAKKPRRATRKPTKG